MLSSIKTQRLDAIALGSLGFLFIIGMHYFQSHPGGSGLQTSFNTFSWIPVSIFIGSTLGLIAQRGVFYFSSLTLLLFGCATALFLPSLFPASNDLVVTGKLYGLGAGFLIFLGLQQLKIDERKIFLVLISILIGTWIEALIGLAQHFQLMPEGLAGYTADDTRAFGILRQRNVMASLLATGLVLSAYMLSMAANLLGRSRLVASAFLVASPLIFIPVLVLNYSRIGWLGAVLGLLLLAPFVFRCAPKKLICYWALSAALGLVISYFILAASEQLMLLAAGKSNLSNPVRENLYPIAMLMFFENWMLGVGYGNFESAFNGFAAEQFSLGLADPLSIANLTHPHNELLFWGIEGGLLALASLLLAAWFVFRTIVNAPSHQRLALSGLFFPIVLHTQLEFPFYHSVVHWVIFVILIFIVDFYGNERRSLVIKPTLLVGTAGIIIPSVTALFMVTTLHASSVLYRYENDPLASPEIIYEIVNPMVWRERILFNVRGNAMLLGLQQGDSSQVQPFIDLVEESIISKPRWQRYQDLIYAYGFLEEYEKVAALRKEAEYRFPNISFSDLSEGVFAIKSLSESEQDPEQDLLDASQDSGGV